MPPSSSALLLALLAVADGTWRPLVRHREPTLEYWSPHNNYRVRPYSPPSFPHSQHSSPHHHQPSSPHHQPPSPHHQPPSPHHQPPSPHHQPPSPHQHPPFPRPQLIFPQQQPPLTAGVTPTLPPVISTTTTPPPAIVMEGHSKVKKYGPVEGSVNSVFQHSDKTHPSTA